MTHKALISELSHRSLKMQRDAFPDMPHYTAPHEIGMVLRPSTRKEQLKLHVVSLAVIADNEKDFRSFIALARKRDVILCLEDGLMLNCKAPINHLIDKWKGSRREGAAKAGGDSKSRNSFLKFWDGFSKIKDRWHLNENSKGLMKEAGIKHHDTVRVNLGYTRWEWRKLSDAKRARVLKQLEKEVRECLKNQ